MSSNLKNKINSIYIYNAIVLFFIPLILIAFSGEYRSSISNYAYSDVNNLFVLLLTIAGTLFINNGITSNKFYNIILGASLYGVALTPHQDFPFLHYLFAGIFFLGSVFVMIYYSSQKQRKYKIIAGVFINIAMVLPIFNIYNLLVAEWIALLPICLHFVGESLNKID